MRQTRLDEDRPPPPPLCHCREASIEYMERYGQRKGSYFWVCKKSLNPSTKDQACNFKQWKPNPLQKPSGSAQQAAQKANKRGSGKQAGNGLGSSTRICMQLVEYKTEETADRHPAAPPEVAQLVELPSGGQGIHHSIIPALEGLRAAHPPLKVEDDKWYFRHEDRLEVGKALAQCCKNTTQHDRIDIEGTHEKIANIIMSARAMLRPRMRWEDSPISPAIQAKLFAHQKVGIEYAISRGGRALIGDEMGLGKTLQAIAVMQHFRREWPALVVCPASMRETWRLQMTQHLGEEPAVIEPGSAASKRALPKGVNLVMSYDIASKRANELESRGIHVIVLDEAHCIKNRTALRTVRLVPLVQKAARALLLTGTPMLNRPREVFTLLESLLPKGEFLSFPDFGKRYCQAEWVEIRGRGGAVMGRRFADGGSSNLEELKLLLRTTCMVRRTKKAVLPGLPRKLRQDVHLELSKDEKTKMRKAIDDFNRKFRPLEELNLDGGDPAGDPMRPTKDENRGLMDLYHATALAKLPAVCDFIKDMHCEGEQVLIFAHHKDMLNGLEECISKICGSRTKQEVAEGGPWRHIRIDGDTKPPSARQKLVDLFQTDKSYKYALLQIEAAGKGLTLTASSTVIFAELYWTPGDLLQAEDRVHRIGQENHCLIQYVLCEGTSDTQLWPMMHEKIDVIGHSLDGDDREHFEPERVNLGRREPGAGTLDRFLGRRERSFVQQGGAQPAAAAGGQQRTLLDMIRPAAAAAAGGGAAAAAGRGVQRPGDPIGGQRKRRRFLPPGSESSQISSAVGQRLDFDASSDAVGIVLGHSPHTGLSDVEAWDDPEPFDPPGFDGAAAAAGAPGTPERDEPPEEAAAAAQMPLVTPGQSEPDDGDAEPVWDADQLLCMTMEFLRDNETAMQVREIYTAIAAENGWEIDQSFKNAMRLAIRKAQWQLQHGSAAGSPPPAEAAAAAAPLPPEGAQPAAAAASPAPARGSSGSRGRGSGRSAPARPRSPSVSSESAWGGGPDSDGDSADGAANPYLQAAARAAAGPPAGAGGGPRRAAGGDGIAKLRKFALPKRRAVAAAAAAAAPPAAPLAADAMDEDDGALF